jgi:hypothetical protein
MACVDQLSGHAENRRGGGALTQLLATHGVSDAVTKSGAPMARLQAVGGRGSANRLANRLAEYAFIDRQTEYPSADDRRSASGALSMLAHVPDAQAPSRTDVTRPFRVGSEPSSACWDARTYTPDK